MDIKLVIFDCAGTLLDFGCCAPLTAFIDAFEMVGLPISEEVARKPMGADKRDHVREILGYSEVASRSRHVLKREPSEELVAEIYDVFSRRLMEIIPQYADPIPGAEETIDWLKNEGIAVGATTGYARPMMRPIETVIESLGIAMDAMICSDEVVQSRPAPWACFKLAERFGCYPMSHCVKVGDTPADIAEGVHASMITVGISETGNEVGLSRGAWNALPPAEQQYRRQKAESRLRSAGANTVLTSVHLLPAWIAKQRAAAEG